MAETDKAEKKKDVLESALQAAGVDVDGAKVALAELDDRFSGLAGDIPDGALGAW